MMEAMILDKNFNNVLTLDNFKSFIWTDVYRGCGDFEVYSSPTEAFLSHAIKDHYIWFRDSEKTMIIETIEIETDADSGNMVSVTGRSLESMLERRIIQSKVSMNANVQDIVERLLTQNVISPGNSKRKIDRFIFERNADLEDNAQENAKDLWVTVDYYGENLYKVIDELCLLFDLGFKITLQTREWEGFERECFVFTLFRGKDRSYDQTERPPVTFSPNFENLLSSKYISSDKNLKNAAWTVVRDNDKENETGYRSGQFVFFEDAIEPSGLDRRETFVECSNSSSSSSTTETVEDATVVSQEGLKALKETETTEEFDGEVDPLGQYQFRRDFDIGDIVQITNEYDMHAKTRVVSVTFSSETTGESIYPTFEKIESK